MMTVLQADREKVKAYLNEAVKTTERILEEQAHLRDIINTLKVDHDIPNAVARRTVTAMRKGNAREQIELDEMFSDLTEIAK